MFDYHDISQIQLLNTFNICFVSIPFTQAYLEAVRVCVLDILTIEQGLRQIWFFEEENKLFAFLVYNKKNLKFHNKSLKINY